MNRLLKLLAAVGLILSFSAFDPGLSLATFPGANGRLVFRLPPSPNLHTMHIDGASLTTLPEGAGFEPQWSPDGAKILFIRTVSTNNSELFVMNADGTASVNVSNSPDTYDVDASWSPDGSRIMFLRANPQPTVTYILVMNADGTGQSSLAAGDGPSWSPDGSKIAFWGGPPSGVWVMNADGTAQTLIGPSSGGFHTPPTWSPDSLRVAFEGASPLGGNLDIYVANVDGTGTTDLTAASSVQELRPIWSPGGSKVYFERKLPAPQWDIFSINADGSGEANVSNSGGDDQHPVWSPDGTKIAFVNNRHGVPEFYTMNPDGSQQIRVAFGVHPFFEPFDWQALPDDADDDNDSLIDATETACGSDPLRDDRRPERIDGPFAGVDDDNDTDIDEPLPPGAANFDCDGDGYRGSAEDHVYSYLSQTNGDQKTCQEYDSAFPNPAAHIKPSLRWPSDLAGGSFSSNKINIQDIAAFTNPIRYLNQDVGTDTNDVRFDLIPGSTVGADINIADLAAITSGPTAFPPMLNGAKAFNGPDCPWPP